MLQPFPEIVSEIIYLFYLHTIFLIFIVVIMTFRIIVPSGLFQKAVEKGNLWVGLVDCFCLVAYQRVIYIRNILYAFFYIINGFSNTSITN